MDPDVYNASVGIETLLRIVAKTSGAVRALYLAKSTDAIFSASVSDE
ncbi:MAG: hypothetical protein M3N54_16375 [Acidobacteriota bacterium]|nr:hypothetical protein [Acidobacteriota bacterium]